MTLSTLSPSRDFANAVRLALADLPADEVDDLTDGLEADLAERAEDEAMPGFGDPLTYANELRAAAGLPPRSGALPSTFGDTVEHARRDLVRGLRDFGALPPIARLIAFAVSLRPVWWVARAWVFYGILTWAFSVPSLNLTPLTFALGAGALITSVQFGRGKWLAGWMRTALLVVNILLIVGSPIIVYATSNAWQSQVNGWYNQGQRDGEHEQNGLEYNGRLISNIFAYDANGAPLSQVQLYDQSGRPLYTVQQPGEPTINGSTFLVPNANVHGRGGWNVYPLGYLTQDQLADTGEPRKGATPTPSRLRDTVIPPLKNATPVPTPAPTPTPAP
jgi:hypothetical protein